MKKLESVESLNNIIENVISDDAYLTELKFSWDTEHNEDGISGFESYPDIRFHLVFPICGTKLDIRLDNVIKSSFDVRSDIEIKVYKKLSTYHFFINQENEIGDNYFECEEVFYKIC